MSPAAPARVHIGPVLLTLAVVVASAAPATAQPTWLLDEPPRLVVGGVSERGAALHQVLAATVMPSGQLAILNSGTDELLVFDSGGALVRRVGGQGQGPGEFMGARALTHDDEGGLWVHDPVNIRVTRFGSDWEVRETRRIGYDVGASSPVPSSVVPLSNGDVPLVKGVAPMQALFMRGEGLHHDSLFVAIHDGEEVREIARYSRGSVFRVRDGSSGLSPLVPFTEETLVGSGPESVVVASSHDTRVSILDREGSEVGWVIAQGSVRPVTGADWQAFQDRFRIERSRSVQIRGVRTDPGRTVEMFLERTPRGETFPLFDEVRMDRQGLVWLREYSLGPSVTWQIVHPDRGVVGRLELDREWRLLDQDASHVVVRVRDELDVEEVRVYGVGR